MYTMVFRLSIVAVILLSFNCSHDVHAFGFRVSSSSPPQTNSIVVVSRDTTTTQLAMAARGGGGGGNKKNGNEETEKVSGRTLMSMSEYIPESSFGADVVPEGQRPVNEYLNLIRSPMFGWAAEEVGTKGLLIRLAAVYAICFVSLCWPIAGATFTQEGYTLQKIAAANVADLAFVLVVLVRLYSGWGYVGSRLTSKVIEYEETGWYDGDFELKSEKEKARDLMLYRNDVQPVETRIKTVSAVVAVAFLLSAVGFKTAMDVKPLFNQYDPDLLERLNNDDMASDVVQRQSNGRPTYCDSRYYRAVANGGQGCDN